MIVSRHKLLQLLGIDKDVFDRLRRAGAPIRPDKKVHVGDFVAFMIEDAVRKARGSTDPNFAYDYLGAKAKDKAHMADLREIEFNKLAGKLVDANDARQVVREVFATVRRRLLAVNVAGLDAENESLLKQALIDATEGLSPEKAEGIGKPHPAFRH